MFAGDDSTSAEALAKPAMGWRIRGVLILIMGCIAIAVAFFAGTLAPFLVGLLLIACGVLELLETFQAATTAQSASSYLGGMLSIGVGALLLSEPKLVLRGLSVFIAVSFLIDGLSKLAAAYRGHSKTTSRRWQVFGGVINVLLGLILITRWPVAGLGVVVIVTGIHMVTTGWSMLLGRVVAARVVEVPDDAAHPDAKLGLPARPEFAQLKSALVEDDQWRWSVNVYWCITFLLVFFAIHIGRMRVEWNVVGMISPLVATLGDVAVAILIAVTLVLPYRLGWRKLTRPLERRCWQRSLACIDDGKQAGWFGRMSSVWLDGRYRFSHRVSQIFSAPTYALSWALQVGLPATAILIAVNPIWGFSWFFNSESWATEVWNRWAEARTDTWREQMILAVKGKYGNIPADQLFAVDPGRVTGSEDFSFLVLGDTGEGDASQLCLKDQFLTLGQRPDVKFMLISSDVIYPTGSMSDYEAKFYLPFKGFKKPIYAIPGNHDWYDALEGFAANFLESDAAKACMHSRVATDNRLTSTTDRRIDDLIREAARLRGEFGISTGHQRGPFLEIRSDRFTLIAVDTGVLRGVDTEQWGWLQAALERAKGTFTMAILGHPLYAGGRYQGGAEAFVSGEWVGEIQPPELPGARHRAQVQPFAAVHQLLRDHGVQIVMAGDTHYFEHYLEKYGSGSQRTMHHFVNGGGGAYASIGTPLDWPKEPAVPDCGYFPRKDFLMAKLDRETPLWKKPLWLWVKHFGGWPFSSEAMAGAFVYDYAPYLQSFVEVRVENSANRVRVILYGASGPVHWKQMQSYGAIKPPEKSDDDPVEFVVAMPAKSP